MEVGNADESLTGAVDRLPIEIADGFKGVVRRVEIADRTANLRTLERDREDLDLDPLCGRLPGVQRLAIRLNPAGRVRVFGDLEDP